MNLIQVMILGLVDRSHRKPSASSTHNYFVSVSQTFNKRVTYGVSSGMNKMGNPFSTRWGSKK